MSALFILLVTLSTSSMAFARDGGAAIRTRLASGRTAYAQQEYREVIRTLRPIVRDPAATRAQKVAALELVGLSMFIIGQTDAARATLEDLLALDPDYLLTEPSESPKLRSFFDDVKRGYLPDFRGGGQAALEHSAPTGAVAGRRLEMSAVILATGTGAATVSSVVLRWRRRGLLEYYDAAMSARRRQPGFVVGLTLPADRGGYALEYYLEARGPAGAVVARAGGPDAPLSLPVRGGTGAVARPWYGRWYIWAGAAAVGASITAAVLISGAEDAPEGSLPPGFARTTPE